jgi:hypothetical protein
MHKLNSNCESSRFIKALRKIQSSTFHCFKPLNSQTYDSIYVCEICNIYLHLDTSKISYPCYFIYSKINDFYYYFIFKYDVDGKIKYSFKINEHITCNEIIIKKLLE